MKKIFKKAHKITREMVKKYGVDYRTQFGLNLSYLLEIKEEEEEMKTSIEVKGFEIKVKGNGLWHYRNNELAAITEDFTSKNSYMTKENMVAIIYHVKTDLAEGKNGIVIKNTEFQELISIKEEIKVAIDKYFEELDNVKIGELSNYSYYLKEENEELKELDPDYYNEIEEKWLEDNKKYIVKIKDEWVKNEMGQMENVREFEFKKANIETIDKEIEERKNNKSESRKESERRYAELYELEETLSSEEFEDITGMKKSSEEY